MHITQTKENTCPKCGGYLCLGKLCYEKEFSLHCFSCGYKEPVKRKEDGQS